MKLKIEVSGKLYETLNTEGFDLSIPLHFSEESMTAFGVPRSSAKRIANEHFVGDTRKGGSCNVTELNNFIPHCHGTHTECIGHIVNQEIEVPSVLKESLFPSTLISVEPEIARLSTETYLPLRQPEDKIISKKILQEKLEGRDLSFFKAIVIRTLPNDSFKLNKDYEEAAYFSFEAIEYLNQLNVEHLLVDTPSIDRMDDGGELNNHRLFWNIPKNSKELQIEAWPQKTVTELIYAPNEAPDGSYLLNLQITPWKLDGVPSRPSLYALKEVKS